MTLQRPRGNFTRELDDAHVLGVVERGRFAGRADGHDAGDAARDLRLDQPRERGFVDFVVVKRRDERRESACKHRAAFLGHASGVGQESFRALSRC